MVFERKYATGTGADIIIPIIKAGVNDFAVSADWTPAAGDVKISKDGGAAANIGTLPTFITDIGWKFVFTNAELTAARINVNVVDSATKAIEDQHIIIETYGHASAQHAFDRNVATPGVEISSIDGAVQADLIDDIWDEPKAGHASAGSFGEEVQNHALSSEIPAAAPSAAAIRSEMDSNSTQLAAIVADTNELQSDDVPGLIAALDTLIDGIKAVTDNLNDTLEDDGGTYRFTTNALEQAPSGGGGGGDATAANQATIIAYVDELESRLTAARALLLDNLDQAISTTENNIRGADGDDLKDLSDQIDAIPGATAGALEVTYTVDDGVSPLDGVEGWITTDVGGSTVVWAGASDALGILRDGNGVKPWLDAGTYYVWLQKSGYTFVNPDSIDVS